MSNITDSDPRSTTFSQLKDSSSSLSVFVNTNNDDRAITTSSNTLSIARVANPRRSHPLPNFVTCINDPRVSSVVNCKFPSLSWKLIPSKVSDVQFMNGVAIAIGSFSKCIDSSFSGVLLNSNLVNFAGNQSQFTSNNGVELVILTDDPRIAILVDVHLNSTKYSFVPKSLIGLRLLQDLIA